jgi:hypothetical protein
MHQLSRRDALRLGALATAVPPTLGARTTGPAQAAAGSAPVPAPAPASWVVTPFANNQVTLRPSLFTANRDRILTFLGAYPADRMLANFRANAGLDTLGAQPPGGWDTADGNLRGHYSGHFMSALALAYAGTADNAYKDKLDYMITALGQCQDALDQKVGQPDGPSHAGFLAAYPETQFVLLEEFATYPRIWAPWYTNHMIMRGLIDAYELTDNQQALRMVQGMADWAYSRLGHLPRSQLDRMWGIYIAGEYNAMAVVMAKLYGLTGNENYLTTAKAFDNTTLFEDAVAGRDTIDGKHANQHIPQYLGYLEIFDQTGDQDYYTAAANFWDMVVPHRIYTDGRLDGRGAVHPRAASRDHHRCGKGRPATLGVTSLKLPGALAGEKAGVDQRRGRYVVGAVQLAHHELDGPAADLLGRDGDGGQPRGHVRGEVLGAHRHHRDVLRDVPAEPAQRLQQRRDGGLVVHDEPRQTGMIVEEPFDGVADRAVRRVAGPDERTQATSGHRGLESGRGPLRETRTALEHGGRRPEEGDLAMTEVGQVIDAHLGRGDEVEVDAGQTLGICGKTDQHGRQAEFTQHRDAAVVELDVHHDHGVDQRGPGHPAQSAGAFVVGQQQNVVIVSAGAGHHRHRELHQDRHVHVGAQRQNERDHVGPAAGQGTRAGVRVVTEDPDALLDPAPGALGDRPFAAENVRHGAG